MADWTDEQREQFARHMEIERERQALEAVTPDVGDLVETPDGRQWSVIRWAAAGALDLANDQGEELHLVSRELVQVIRKA
jgi:hypothetical protein